MTQSAAQSLLPFGYVMIANRIQTARVQHTLDCGCHIRPGMTYHYIAMRYKFKPSTAPNQIVSLKRHIVGCLETLH